MPRAVLIGLLVAALLSFGGAPVFAEDDVSAGTDGATETTADPVLPPGDEPPLDPASESAPTSAPPPPPLPDFTLVTETTSTEATTTLPADPGILNPPPVESETNPPSDSTPDLPAEVSVAESDPLIVTGDAFAAANILNVVNANIVNSDGFLSLLTLFGQLTGDVVLPDPGAGEEGESLCCGTDLSVLNTSEAAVINDVTVTASTGGNGATGDSSTIVTGEAAAAVNVVNIVNTNIVSSRYLLFVLNNFGSWVGDLVLPGREFFSNRFGGGGVTHVSNHNTAAVVNTVSAGAETGGNTAGVGSLIATGNAGAVSNVMTSANTNYFGGSSAMVLVRVFGNWSGNVFSTPPGISWQRTPNGILLFSTPGYGLDADGETPCCGGGLTVANTNTANIQNNVQVYALTGENEIGADGTILTGDASAVANVVNLANTNIVGENWLLAIANVFGDWDGNLAFGQPDLWVGARADVSRNPLAAGSDLTYTVTLANRGTADATQVVLVNALGDADRFSFGELGGGTLGDGAIRWTLSVLPAGASTTFTYTAAVGHGLPRGLSTLAMSAEVTSFEPDADLADNRDSLALAFEGDPPGTGSSWYGWGLPIMTFAKWNDATGPVVPPALVPSHLRIANDGPGAMFDSVVSDTLYDPTGKIIASSTWPLDVIYPRDEIYIDYDAVFSTNATSGVYTNVARMTGRSWFNDWHLDVSATSSFVIDNPNYIATATTTPAVLGESTCGAYLSSYLWYGRRNNPEDVERLQTFLNDHEDANIPVTGYFGELTKAAVERFQEKYYSDILAPWDSIPGYQYASLGNVYKTTTWKINSLVCGNISYPPIVLP
ncbi:MAG: peptidoglycan-binding protein [Patescibacteria group bacterium]